MTIPQPKPHPRDDARRRREAKIEARAQRAATKAYVKAYDANVCHTEAEHEWVVGAANDAAETAYWAVMDKAHQEASP